MAKLPAKNKNCREFTLSGFPANLVARTAAGPRPFLASGSPKKYHCRAPTPLPEVRRPYSFHILLYQLLTFFPSFGSAYQNNNIQGTSFNPARFANSDSTLYILPRFRLVPFVRFSSGHRALNWGLGDLFLVPFAISRLQLSSPIHIFDVVFSAAH